jgi:TonB family protein
MNQKKKKFLNKPFYPGGNEAMDAFIKEALQYPEEALAAQKEGTVKVKLTMDHKGKVIHAEAVNSLGYGLEEEAVRVIRLLHFKVAKNDKVKVTFHKELNIHFKLPPPKPKAPTQEQAAQVQYNYIYRPAAPKKEPAKKGYSYQINRG